MEKKNFQLFQRVKVVKCGDITDNTGTILGKSAVNVDDHYIVLLDESRQLLDGYEVVAFTVTEHCLEAIDDVVVEQIGIITKD